jgi:hypothetical protein
LHELFPVETGLYLTHLKQVCLISSCTSSNIGDAEISVFFSFDEWLSLSRQTLERIEKFEFNMIKSSKVFSDQLCFNLQALFVNDPIIKYAGKISSYEKFKLMVQVLYY